MELKHAEVFLGTMDGDDGGEGGGGSSDANIDDGDADFDIEQAALALLGDVHDGGLWNLKF